MWSQDARIFDELATECGSRYLATIFIFRSARKLSTRLPNWIQESKLISWVLTGKGMSPGEIDRLWRIDNLELYNLSDFLCYVEDEAVKASVIESYKLSSKRCHLVYSYHKSLSESKKARVRVLLRMVWYDAISQED